jgi:CBS domain-containing protein
MECPACGHENLPGEDTCEQCQEDLTGLSVPLPKHGRLHELILEDPLSQLNAPRPITLGLKESVASAVQEMRKHRFGSVLILDTTGKLAGIFTERDLLRRLAGWERPLEEVALEEVMTRQPETLTEEDTIANALNHMAVGGYRHIPIVRDGEPIGFVSIRGILTYIAQNAL